MAEEHLPEEDDSRVNQDPAPASENGSENAPAENPAPDKKEEDRDSKAGAKEKAEDHLPEAEMDKENPEPSSPETGIEISKVQDPFTDKTEAGEDPEKAERKKKETKRRKKKRRRRVARVIALLLVLCVAAYAWKTYEARQNAVTVEYLPATAQTQDITTTDTFTGTIAAVDSQSVMSAVSGATVTEVDVAEGDMVEEGDVIARLDTSDVEDSIKQLQLQMSTTAASNNLSIESAQANYDDLVNDIADGLNSTVNNALSSIDSAFQSLLQAQTNYNNEVLLNNDANSDTISSAISQVESAYQQTQSAAMQLQNAYTNKEDAIYQYEKTLKEGETSDFDGTSYDQTIASAQMSYDNAETAYNEALASYELAKTTEDNNLISLYDQVITAENSYIEAIQSYNTTMRSIQEQLDSYERQIASAKLSADQSQQELQLSELEDSLSDYVITAPMSGEITELNCKAGDITEVSSTTSLATITNYDKMSVSISVSEYDISQLSVGSSVTVTVDALGRDFDGTVTSIDKIGTNSSSIAYFTCEVQFTPDDDVLEGMTAEVSLTVTEADDAVVLPSDAIMTDTDGSSYVYILQDDGTYAKQVVTLGETDGSYTQVTDGVSSGDTVYYTIATADTTESSDSSGGLAGLFSSLTGGSSSGGAPQGGGGGGGMPSGGGDMGGGPGGGGGGMPQQ